MQRPPKASVLQNFSPFKQTIRVHWPASHRACGGQSQLPLHVFASTLLPPSRASAPPAAVAAIAFRTVRRGLPVARALVSSSNRSALTTVTSALGIPPV